jgi:putative transposase
MGRLTHRTLPGSTYFVTTKAWQSMSVFQVAQTAEIVISKTLEYRDKGNYLLHEFVLMPNHLHLIITPADDVTLEKAIQLIKGGSSYEIHRIRENKMQIWQSGFHESRVTDWKDYKNKMDYVRFNPVAAKLIDRPQDWLYGSGSGKYLLDPIPQGLKPPLSEPLNVGAKAPTPTAAKAPTVPAQTPGLKPRPPKEETGFRSKGPAIDSVVAPELKLRPREEKNAKGHEAPTPRNAASKAAKS